MLCHFLFGGKHFSSKEKQKWQKGFSGTISIESIWTVERGIRALRSRSETSVNGEVPMYRRDHNGTPKRDPGLTTPFDPPRGEEFRLKKLREDHDLSPRTRLLIILTFIGVIGLLVWHKYANPIPADQKPAVRHGFAEYPWQIRDQNKDKTNNVDPGR